MSLYYDETSEGKESIVELDWKNIRRVWCGQGADVVTGQILAIVWVCGGVVVVTDTR